MGTPEQPELIELSGEEYLAFVGRYGFTAYIWTGSAWERLGEAPTAEEAFEQVQRSPHWPAPACVRRSCFPGPTDPPGTSELDRLALAGLIAAPVVLDPGRGPV